ncbi:Druantia anti-phage system protein DruA [Candidatus Accumulibacter sp. ACC003]|uniref:Druantia anti-phage system protein DruA n=1 Tax=Candidatus Accumulibacter sp. ACC003 TaxID=2823334 RepID=UPI003450E1DA
MRWWRAGTHWVSRGPFGYRLRYFITAGDRRLGSVLLAGAARAVAVRDRWIGWTAQARRENLARVVNNSRFLIFPHVRVPHLASHVLGQLARRARADWLDHWGFEPLLLETFVDPRHYNRHLLPRGRLAVARGNQRARAGPPRPVVSQHAPPGVAQTAERRLSRPAVCRPWELPAMSKPCRRPTRAALKELRSEKKRQEKALNAKRRATFPRGQVPPPTDRPTDAPASRPSARNIKNKREKGRPEPAEDTAFVQQKRSPPPRLLRKDTPALSQPTGHNKLPSTRERPRKRRHKLTALLCFRFLSVSVRLSSSPLGAIATRTPRDANPAAVPTLMATSPVFPEIGRPSPIHTHTSPTRRHPCSALPCLAVPAARHRPWTHP